MNNNESNKLIGKFMGIQVRTYMGGRVSYNPDKDWALLMPVIDKLESISRPEPDRKDEFLVCDIRMEFCSTSKENGDPCYTTTITASYKDYDFGYIAEVSHRRIESVYKAAVRLIEYLTPFIVD